MKWLLATCSSLFLLTCVQTASAQFNNPQASGGALAKGDSVAGSLTGSSGVDDFLTFDMTVNQSGTGGFHGLDLNLTLTAQGSGVQYPISVKVDGSYLFALEDNGNMYIVSAAQAALIIKNTSLTDDPVFSIGRIETTAVGDGFFISFADDLTATRKIWGVEETGTVASLMAAGSSGISHFEAFENGGVNPYFRLSTANGATGLEARDRDTDENDYLYFRRYSLNKHFRICDAAGAVACAADPAGLTIEGIAAAEIYSDLAVPELLVSSGDAFPIGVTNNDGGDLKLSGGHGAERAGILNWNNCSGDTLTVTVDGSATVLTEGADWTASGTNATTASSLADAVDTVAHVRKYYSDVWAGVRRDKHVTTVSLATSDATCILIVEGEQGAVTVNSSGLVPAKLTGDPCALNGYPEGALFYNASSNYMCYCDGTNDVQMHDPTTACF